jgi:alpha-tubulin suppressor-like RCC1 family protein
MPGFAQMSTGYQATCGLTSDGSAYCWGNGELGDLGNGSAANELVPAEVPGLSGLQAIGQAGGTTCVITSRGADKCWGDSYEGEFGDNKAETQSYTPVQVSGLTSGVQSISMGFGGANCALLAGGAARCWGQNTNGEVGNGTTAPQNTPVTVSGLSSGVTSIAAGGDHTCAVKSAAVWCWGAGATLGNGTSNASSVPVAVSGLTSGVVSVVAGESHTCALTSGGAVWCWGHDGTGQLGIDQIGNPVLVPTEVIGLDHGVTALDLGDHNSCATKSDGTLWCWGGTVGVGIKTYPTPVLVGGVAPGATMLSTDGDHTCVGSQVAMQCLGQQFDGDLGDGVDGNGTPPAPVAPQFSWG